MLIWTGWIGPISKFFWYQMFQVWLVLLVIRQKSESQKECFKKKSTPNFLKNKHFLPQDPGGKKCLCAYQGVRNVCFLENLAYFVFLKHKLWDLPFCLLTGSSRVRVHNNYFQFEYIANSSKPLFEFQILKTWLFI